MKLLSIVSVVVATAAANTCPGSSAFVHAKCSLSVSFPDNSCQEVASELIARVNGVNSWTDPHNGGTYSVTSGTSSSSVITTERVTGDKKYTDKHKWTYTTKGSGCEVTACSESQVTSVIDYSTNYCNLHDLYCGSKDGCPVAEKDFTSYTETFNSCWQHDKSKCTPKKTIIAKKAPEGECKKVETAATFNLTTFISAPWYIQQQMSVAYLPESQNYCVSARYTMQEKTLFGYTISVDNRAYESDKTTKHGGKLCAVEDSSDDPAKLMVAPCFLPKFAAGPYWVLDYDEKIGYALISGGQPTIPGKDGCKTGSGVNNAGLWIFTRQQQRDDDVVNMVRGVAKAKGFDLSVLNDVDQSECPP